MSINITEILTTLQRHNIVPENEDPTENLPEVGQVIEGETIYSTSLDDVLPTGEDDWPPNGVTALDDDRIRGWLDEIKEISDTVTKNGPRNSLSPAHNPIVRIKNPCAWYCPIHYYGHGWGIYIRESCILSIASQIAWFVDWRLVGYSNRSKAAKELLRSAFYVLFLHEQFHHKVESLGFRLLVSRGLDSYRPYKKNVYRATHLTKDCLEESLAEADSYRRLKEERYKNRVSPPIYKAVRTFLNLTIPVGSPGYAEGALYLSDLKNHKGLNLLQTQIREGLINPLGSVNDWDMAPGMTRALMNIDREIYVVLPRHSSPIFRPSVVDPRLTASTKDVMDALIKHYGYSVSPGGKGSHVKLKKPGSQTVILPGNRPVLSPGIIRQAIEALGGKSISTLPDMLSGRLVAT